MSLKLHTAAALRALRQALNGENGSFNPNQGICRQAQLSFLAFIPAGYDELASAFAAWPENPDRRRGFPVYVGSDYTPDTPCAPPTQYYAASRDGTMFDPDTEYGAARLRLLDFCIEYLEAGCEA